jgi:uroporphyrinogen III methyltransferase / synthase
MTLPTHETPAPVTPILHGRKILVTRPRQQASRFSALLRAHGAEPIEVPTIQIAPPSSWEALDRAIAAITSYDWLVFTSANSVQSFFTRFGQQQSPTALPRLKYCAIGPETAKQLQAHGVRVDVMPTEYRAEAVVQALSAFPLQGSRILLPRAAVARDVLPQALATRGAQVEVVEVYRTVLPDDALEPAVQRLFAQRQIDVVTFTSSSTVTNFAALTKETDLSRLLDGAVVACIGPITAESVRSYGVTPTIVAQEYTIPGLTRAIVEYFQGIEASGHPGTR